MGHVYKNTSHPYARIIIHSYEKGCQALYEKNNKKLRIILIVVLVLLIGVFVFATTMFVIDKVRSSREDNANREIVDGVRSQRDQVMQDAEGLQIMRMLGRNMAWFLRMRKAAGDAGITPPQPEKDVYFTNFIR